MQDLPEGWSDMHSIATLLIGAACVDGELADSELRDLVKRLERYDHGRSDRVAEVAKSARDYVSTVFRAQGKEGVWGTASEHCALLAGSHSPEALRLVLSDIASVVSADGVVDAQEEAYFHMVAAQWGQIA